MKLNRVVTAVDDNYLLPLLVMAFSAKKNSIDDFEIIVGYDKNRLSASNREIISKCFEIFEIPHQLESFSLSADFVDNRHISATTFLRLLMFDSIYGNVLWLDVDLICLPEWDEIFTEYAAEMERNIICAAKNNLDYPEEILATTNNMALQVMGENYFNTGVALVNCDLWRREKIDKNWPYLHSNYEEFGFQFSDQCIINFACVDYYKILSSKYNSLAATQKRNPIEGRRILHFAGWFKPWQFTKYGSRVFFSGLIRSDVLQYLRLQSEVMELLKFHSPEIVLKLDQISVSFAKEKTFYSFSKVVLLNKMIERKWGILLLRFLVRLKNSK